MLSGVGAAGALRSTAAGAPALQTVLVVAVLVMVWLYGCSRLDRLASYVFRGCVLPNWNFV